MNWCENNLQAYDWMTQWRTKNIMAKPIFSNLDNLSLQDIESEADLIPLLTPEDEEALEREDLPNEVPILPLRNTVLFLVLLFQSQLGETNPFNWSRMQTKAQKLSVWLPKKIKQLKIQVLKTFIL